MLIKVKIYRTVNEYAEARERERERLGLIPGFDVLKNELILL